MVSFWTDLGDADAERANLAAENLFNSGRAVPLLKAELKPDVLKVDAAQVARWITQLDANDFAIREKATHELDRLGPAAAPALMRAVGLATSLEAQRRMEGLLQKTNAAPQVSRQLRAVELLSRIGSPAARDLLTSLAKGPPDAILTEAALWALPPADESPR
jgi:hypothetical protein